MGDTQCNRFEKVHFAFHLTHKRGPNLPIIRGHGWARLGPEHAVASYLLVLTTCRLVGLLPNNNENKLPTPYSPLFTGLYLPNSISWHLTGDSSSPHSFHERDAPEQPGLWLVRYVCTRVLRTEYGVRPRKHARWAGHVAGVLCLWAPVELTGGRQHIEFCPLKCHLMENSSRDLLADLIN